MNCPCIDCVCVAICRNKLYYDLFKFCDLIRKYEPHYGIRYLRNRSSMEIIGKTLKPTTWEYSTDHYIGVKVPMKICL